MRAQTEFVGSVLRVTGVRAAERMQKAKPVTDLTEIPADVSQLTPEWLTAALGRSVHGAEVTSFKLGTGSDGTSSRRAISVTWNDVGRRANLPTHVFAKSTPSLVNRLLVGVTGAAGAEALFYSSIRQHLPIGAPEGYFGAWDPRTCRSIVLTEDIAVGRGATFADASTMYVDRSAAEGMVTEMANYHGALWEDPRLDTEWATITDAETWQKNFNAKTAFDRGAILGMRLADEEVPTELHARKSEIRSAFMTSLAYNVHGPRTLLHQDVHPANWFRLPDGSLNLYDWQGIAKGGWALDVSYALSAALTVEDRRAWERDLLALYLDRLGAAGGKPPAFDDAWLAYRQQMFHGFIFWTYTFLVGKVAPLQPDAHVRAMIRRTSRAMVDLESLDSV